MQNPDVNSPGGIGMGGGARHEMSVQHSIYGR